MTRPRVPSVAAAHPGWAALTLAWTALCIGPGHTWMMHLLHPLCFGAISLWGLLLARRIVETSRLARTLEPMSRPGAVGGIACRIVPGSDLGAFSIGIRRPNIYVGEAALARLDREEQAAVLLHEEHHRRTIAPVRAAAVDSWVAIVGWLPVVGGQVQARLIDLEVDADRFAIDHGVEPATIASALLKMPASPALAGFATGAAARVSQLTSGAADGPSPRAAVPWEWVPLAVAAYTLITCLTVTLLRML